MFAEVRSGVSSEGFALLNIAICSFIVKDLIELKFSLSYAK